MKKGYSKQEQRWSTAGLDALIFDLDGVITQTAVVHMNAWQQMFESYFQDYRSRTGTEVAPYNGRDDYLQYVDGKPRYDGVRSLLESRNINIPQGSPEDEPEQDTICGLGNRKNLIFQELLRKGGVHVFEDTIEKVRQWRTQGLKTAVISSSKNCKAVLEAAHIEHLFDVRIDGIISAQLGIPGKPAPDIFLRAAEQLKTDAARSAIFEDAIAGVQAGRAGHFKYVVGVARQGAGDDLRENGANLVIHSFADLQE